jgi:tetratricopeptide (TPR) repeat protein
MQRDSGLPFLVFNLARKGNLAWARTWAQLILTKDVEVDEEIRSVLYWIIELHWFTHEKQAPIADHEESIRYLYHLCFTQPERAGFLEIDSQFFSQFETVNELAREGFLFKETLLEKVMWLWREHEGYFDDIFRGALEAMTEQKSKIYDSRESWERFWKRESENFCRDYLYVVEGNLCYARGHFDDACLYYEKALELNPKLRSALLNVVFCYARLGKEGMHEMTVERIVADDSLLPSALFVAGNSYLLLGNSARAEAYYDELKTFDGWARKTEYYKSTFCYENGLYEKALEYARRAHEQSPTDTSIRYHLSLCYNAVGEKDRALDMVRKVDGAPQWLSYYRFTLERDSGRHHDASETLMSIPSDYFEDPEEFEAALEFARTRKDLVLLRHLRNRA